jgi:hypothetical protein
MEEVIISHIGDQIPQIVRAQWAIVFSYGSSFIHVRIIKRAIKVELYISKCVDVDIKYVNGVTRHIISGRTECLFKSGPSLMELLSIIESACNCIDDSISDESISVAKDSLKNIIV